MPRKFNGSGFGALIGGILMAFFADICAVGDGKTGNDKAGGRGDEGTREKENKGTGASGI
jgi:hypothetical protein